MLELTTRQAQRVMRRAWLETERLGLQYFVDAQFLGILGESTCVAAQILKRMGLDLRQAIREVESLARSGELSAGSSDPMGWAEAATLAKQRPGRCMDTPYLLYGILSCSGNAAVRVLSQHGLVLDEVRSAAAAACGMSAEAEGGTIPHGGSKAPAVWLEELQDANPKVRLQAATILPAVMTIEGVELDADETVPLLVDLLRDRDVMVRQAAADALGHFGPAARAAVPALRTSLKDQEVVRSQAADALRRIQEGAGDADIFLLALEDESLSVRVSAAAGLWNATKQPERVLPVLIDGLASKDEIVRGKAAETVAKIGPAAAAAVPALLKALEGSLEQPGIFGPISLTCLTAAKALAAIGPEARAAVPLLIRVLCEKNLLLSQPAGAALVAIAPAAPEVVQALVETLHAGEANVRMAAAGLLGQLGPLGERAVPALRETLADASALVRLTSAASLWKLGSREGVLGILTAALESKEDLVAAAAAGTLGTLGPEAVEAVPALRAASQSPDRVDRVCAAGALWKIEGNAEAVLPVLQAALAGDEQGERYQAVINLGQMGPAAAVVLPELLSALSSADRLLGRLAKNALAQISPAASLEADKPIVSSKKLEMTRLAGQLQRGGAPQDIGQHRRSPSREVDDWSEAIERDRDDVQAYRCRARASHDKGDFVAASNDWTHVIRLDPDDSQGYLQRGISELNRKDYDGAIADFDEVLRRNPNSFDGYNQRAIARKRRGDFDLAIADYTQALRIRPDSAQLHFNRSIAARAKNDYGAALADLQEALRLKPDYPAAHNNLAWYLATIPDEHVRDGSRAVEHARRACDLSGWGNPLFLCTFAAAHAEAGQFDEAIRWQKEALERVRKLEPGRLEEFQEHLRAFEERRPVRKE